MTVLQFRQPSQAPVESPISPKMPSPFRFAKAWLCIVIGLSLSPWIKWLELLSERDEEIVERKRR